LSKYPEDVRQAITDANHLLECEDEAEQSRPPGAWIDCACRLYWSHDAMDQHMMFCSLHAPHAARFIEELKGQALPQGVQKQSIAGLIEQARLETGAARGNDA
jgi:hypothetical protein